MTPAVAVAWFRRDLRIHDHPALLRAVGEFGRVAPLFVVDARLVGGRSEAGRGGLVSANRIWFMRGSVAELARQLAQRGAEMSFLAGDPAELVPRFAAEIGARAVVVSRDFSPYGRRRDDRVARACASHGIDFISETGVLVHEPEDVHRSDGARRFDPDGAYVRRWVPELAACDDLPGAAVHEPPPGAYLAPVVDPAEGRQRALTAYRAARGRDLGRSRWKEAPRP